MDRDVVFAAGVAAVVARVLPIADQTIGPWFWVSAGLIKASTSSRCLTQPIDVADSRSRLLGQDVAERGAGVGVVGNREVFVLGVARQEDRHVEVLCFQVGDIGRRRFRPLKVSVPTYVDRDLKKVSLLNVSSLARVFVGLDIHLQECMAEANLQLRAPVCRLGRRQR